LIALLQIPSELCLLKDNCHSSSGPNDKTQLFKQFALFRDALNKTGRPMIFSAPWQHLGNTLATPWQHLGNTLATPWQHFITSYMLFKSFQHGIMHLLCFCRVILPP